MRRTPVSSEAIASVGYDPTRQLLEIEFTGGGVYLYARVPPTVYEQLMSAESRGRYFMANIRNVYRYRRLPDTRRARDVRSAE